MRVVALMKLKMRCEEWMDDAKGAAKRGDVLSSGCSVASGCWRPVKATYLVQQTTTQSRQMLGTWTLAAVVKSCGWLASSLCSVTGAMRWSR